MSWPQINTSNLNPGPLGIVGAGGTVSATGVVCQLGAGAGNPTLTQVKRSTVILDGTNATTSAVTASIWTWDSVRGAWVTGTFNYTDLLVNYGSISVTAGTSQVFGLNFPFEGLQVQISAIGGGTFTAVILGCA